MSIVKAAECTYNIILASEVMGLSHKERKMVAEIIRQSALKTERTLDMELEEEFMEDGIRIRKLSALLSIADFMDLSHRQKVLGIRLKQEKTEWKVCVCVASTNLIYKKPRRNVGKNDTKGLEG